MNKYDSGIKKVKYKSCFGELEAVPLPPEKMCMVHITKYIPKKNKLGQTVIETTSAATNYKFVRTTIHTTINHPVENHLYGSWYDHPIAILAPYNDTVKLNGNPYELAAVDTYWSVDPDKGLILPDNFIMVQPAQDLPNDSLFITLPYGTFYKSGKFTAQQEKQIIEMATEYEKERLSAYQGESRQKELTTIVRDHAIIKTGKNMGFDMLSASHSITDRIAATGAMLGLRYSDYNNGHSGTYLSGLQKYARTADIKLESLEKRIQKGNLKNKEDIIKELDSECDISIDILNNRKKQDPLTIFPRAKKYIDKVDEHTLKAYKRWLDNFMKKAFSLIDDDKSKQVIKFVANTELKGQNSSTDR